MVEHVWSVLCRDSVIDQETNNISLQNIFEQFTLFAEPQTGGVLPVQMELVTLWIRKDADQPCEELSRVSFINPSGKNKDPIELKIDLTKAERSRNRLIINGLPIEESGRHIFRVELHDRNTGEWNVIASVPITIIFSPKKEA